MVATELDYIKFSCSKTLSAALLGEVRNIVIRFVYVCQIAGCEHRLSVSLCDSRESGLMLVLLLCLGCMLPHSAAATNEARHSCPERK